MPDLHHMPETTHSEDLRNYKGGALLLLNARDKVSEFEC